MMDIDSEHLGIPDQEYACVVEMPASEFQKTCRDLSMFSDSLSITATKVDCPYNKRSFFRRRSRSLEKATLARLLSPTVRRLTAMTNLMYVSLYLGGALGRHSECPRARYGELLDQVHEPVHEGDSSIGSRASLAVRRGAGRRGVQHPGQRLPPLLPRPED